MIVISKLNQSSWTLKNIENTPSKQTLTLPTALLAVMNISRDWDPAENSEAIDTYIKL